MLLQRLIERPRAEHAAGPRFYRDRAVRWQLALTSGGDLASVTLIDLADPSDKTRKNGTVLPVPHTTRAAGVAPCAGADDLQYVLGWCDDNSKPDRVQQCHASFAGLVKKWATAFPEDGAAAAVAAFYTAGKDTAVARPQTWASKQLVLLTVGGQPVTELPSLQQFWASEVERRKTSGPGGARRGVCLVCAEEATLLNTLPQLVPRRLIPLAGNDASLVSGNERIHTYDFTTGLSTVPICISCGTGAVTSLKEVLSAPKSHLSYGDSTLGWWVTGDQP